MFYVSALVKGYTGLKGVQFRAVSLI